MKNSITKFEYKLLGKIGNISSQFPISCKKTEMIPKNMLIDKIKDFIKKDIKFNRFLIERYLKIIKKIS